MACLSRHDKQAKWRPLYDLLSDSVFLNKGEIRGVGKYPLP